MRVRLRVRPPVPAGGQAPPERVVELEAADGEIRAGRQAGLALELPFATVSLVHARLARSGGGWTVTDLDSANGTFVRGRRVEHHVAAGFGHGDELRFADVVVVFDGEVAEAAGALPGAESTATIARRLVSDLFAGARAAEVPRLVVEKGGPPGHGVDLAASGRTYRIGRGSACDLVLDDPDVSREHATFERSWDGVIVRDLGSKNGIAVAGEKVVSSRLLRDGDVMVIGATRLRVDVPEDRYLGKMREREPDASPRDGDPLVSGPAHGGDAKRSVPEAGRAGAAPVSAVSAPPPDAGVLPPPAGAPASLGAAPPASSAHATPPSVAMGAAVVVLGALVSLALWLALGG